MFDTLLLFILFIINTVCIISAIITIYALLKAICSSSVYEEANWIRFAVKALIINTAADLILMANRLFE